jgi:hypothetical protein
MDAAALELSIAYMVSVPCAKDSRMRLPRVSDLTRTEQTFRDSAG